MFVWVIVIAVLFLIAAVVWYQRKPKKRGFSEGLPFYCGWHLDRLGDMVKTHARRAKAEAYHHQNFPGSLASEYMRQTTEEMNLPVLEKLVAERVHAGAEVPSPDTAVVHVRAGDVIDNNRNSLEAILQDRCLHPKDYRCWYVRSRSYFQRKAGALKKKAKRVILVSGSHKRRKGGFPKSTEYLYAVQKCFEDAGYPTTLRVGRDPDSDFVYMSRANIYVPTGGGYSRIIALLVSRNGGAVM